MSFWFKSGVDKIILTTYISLSANGIYSIAFTLTSIVGIFNGAFFNAYTPILFKELSNIDILEEEQGWFIKKKLVRNTYYFAAALLAICVGSYFFLKYAILLLFSGDYLIAVNFLPILLITLFFDGMYCIVSGYIFYRKKTKILGAITFLSSMLQILFTLALVKNFGVMGAAYSSSIISLITFIAVLIYANKLYDLPWGIIESFKNIK